MPVGTSSSADIELIGADGTVVPLMLARPMADDGIAWRDEGPIVIEEELVASGAGAPLAEWLQPRVLEDWFPGVGVAYDAAPGCDTFSSPGYVFPGGYPTNIPLAAVQNSNSPIVALADWGGDLWVAQRGTGAANTARVMRSVGGTAALTDSLNLGANEYLRDLVRLRRSVGAGELLWATSSGINGDAGRMHWYDGAAGVWNSTAAATFGTWGRNRTVAVYWEGDDGIGDWRLVSLSSNQGHVSYTRPGGDPFVAAGWIEGVKVGTGEHIHELAVARRHVYLISNENIYDLTELGESPALTSYTPRHRANLGAAFYFQGYVYRSLGFGLDRVQVQEPGVLADAPGFCAPGWATRSESEWTSGHPTAFTTYLGGIVAAFGALNGRPALFWGVDRSLVGVETPNPLVWHGPFATSSGNEAVTTMLVTSSVTAPSSAGLLAATWHVSQAQTPKLTSISLPAAGGALNDLRTSGGHRFATGAAVAGTTWQPECRLYSLPDTLGDKASVKHIFQQTIGSRGLNDPVGTKLQAYFRADAQPASAAWGSAVDVPTGPTYALTPSPTSGHQIETRLDLISPSGASTPPKPAIVDSIRTDYWRTAPDFDTWTFDVIYGDGVIGIDGTHWPNRGQSVEYYTERLLALARSDRITMRDRQNKRWSIKVRHLLTRTATMHEGAYGRTVRARLVVAMLGAS